MGPEAGKEPTRSVPGSPNRHNNFDLIRLLAALQVVFGHTVSHLNIKHPLVAAAAEVIKLFPGVPIFFFLSGFLVYWSYDRTPDLWRFSRNRILRLYPGLWAAFLVTCGLLLYFGVVRFRDFLTPSLAGWVLRQVTIFPVDTPELLRPWGAHNPNGSLWTIIVELQYYVAVPLLHRLLRGKNWKTTWTGLFVASFITTLMLSLIPEHLSQATKLAGVVLLPYLMYFLLGIGLYKEWPRVSGYLENKGLAWMGAYLAFAGIFSAWLGWYNVDYRPSALGLVGYVILAGAVMSLAYTKPLSATRLLGGNDISYGVYIYHMLIVNSFISLGLTERYWMLPMTYLVVCVVAFLSWKLIESPALRLKTRF